ncbi:hypothetical protein HO133_007279 [Letharia lupina]|uniref:Uncharacterized protein n=1 Tax=Letharia lupina TaxID=560253 RepID=A0A8H6FIH8_9LECA|nr:uncharacterized protein HO133_007279 [Letharia lupina]KAF6229163.1 hypothetical protein HO133_007279 [Letharia lupina]
MPGDSGTIEKLPKELLLRILRHLYPPAAFQPFDMESNCQEDSAWHDRLLSAHFDIVNFSKVPRLFHALSVSLAQSHSRFITEEKKKGLILHAVNEFSLAYVEKTGMMRKLERVFQGGMRTITSDIVAKEAAEHFDPLSWLYVGYNHTRRAMRCRHIIRRPGKLVRDGHIGFGKDKWLVRWLVVLETPEQLPPQVLAVTV